ncbi:MAG: glycosyl transferase family 2, partial [Planctomycetes bacterium]|nr:glycosyl transferase family 2 [Planctomycetota bacterium]
PGARPLLKFFNWLMRTFKLAAGCFVYCLRTAYEETGGFDEKVYASEEIWFSRALKRWGKPRGLTFDIILEPPVVTSSRKLDYPGSLVLAIIVAVFFPFALYFRPLCWLWYKRMPRKSEHF